MAGLASRNTPQVPNISSQTVGSRRVQRNAWVQRSSKAASGPSRNGRCQRPSSFSRLGAKRPAWPSTTSAQTAWTAQAHATSRHAMLSKAPESPLPLKATAHLQAPPLPATQRRAPSQALPRTGMALGPWLLTILHASSPLSEFLERKSERARELGDGGREEGRKGVSEFLALEALEFNTEITGTKATAENAARAELRRNSRS